MRFKPPIRSAALLVLMLLALPTCNSSPDNSPTTPPPPPAPVQNATVTLNANNTFSPSTVTVFAGGTVTFRNQGGGGHNVTANDGSFRCANGCDASGGNGNPATNAWSVTITFPNAGSVPYNCEVHVAAGMTGTVIVQ